MKVRVKPWDEKDRKLAKKIEAKMQRAFVNLVLYGPDRGRWPN